MLYVAQFINALQLGSIYALIALGYSMVYGIIKLLNFAHGDVIMVGGYVAIFALAAGFHPVVAVILVILGCTALAIIMEKLAYTPLRTAPRISVLITAIGISLLLQNLAQLFFGARPQPIHIPFPTGSISIGAVSIAYPMIITIGVAVLSMVALNYIVQGTKLGKAMRAVSEDTQAAQLMGINVNSIITFTFAVGAALAGIGAILFFVRFPVVTPTVGAMLGLKAFIAAVLGGIGSIPGAMLGGFAIGFLEVIVNAVGLSRWTDGAVFLVLIIILLVRPAGLVGKPMIEKV
ncbi:MAG: branched-chain amino acid ABC transporter permease [Oscillospiraceae bacterium]|nr:branched-chain amino acid ABC transporter permease [Oscillospiraceae bacterium]